MWIVVSVSLPLQYSKLQQHKGVLALAEYAGAAIKNIAPSGRYIFWMHSGYRTQSAK